MQIIIATILLIFIGLYLFDKICLWVEDHGFLYYRRKKSNGSSVGHALLELQRFLNPSARHTIEMKQSTVKFKISNSDSARDILK